MAAHGQEFAPTGEEGEAEQSAEADDGEFRADADADDDDDMDISEDAHAPGKSAKETAREELKARPCPRLSSIACCSRGA